MLSMRSTVTRPSRDASIKPRLYARSSRSWVCNRTWSVMSRALTNMPCTRSFVSLNADTRNDTLRCRPSRVAKVRAQSATTPFSKVSLTTAAVRSGSEKCLAKPVPIRCFGEKAAHLAHARVDIGDGSRGIRRDQTIHRNLDQTAIGREIDVSGRVGQGRCIDKVLPASRCSCYAAAQGSPPDPAGQHG